jgi:hypothetical protein
LRKIEGKVLKKGKSTWVFGHAGKLNMQEKQK